MSAWYSIEVFDGATSASVWAEAYRDVLMETAVTSGASDWSWHRHTWGVVFEVCFADEQAWEAYANLPVVQAALDAVPDPLTGLIVYRGRGGSSGAPFPRKPRPLVGSGSAALPLPWVLSSDEILSLTSLSLPTLTLSGVGAARG
ncbi:MAG TPA: hypothetical protein VFH58_06940 [Acidimicrobiales bacterium]|nr:hypothetical protein [Acidimicrobiales bacterium]